MGNFLRKELEEDHIVRLVSDSNNTLTSELIYEIMMKSNFSARELIPLYRKFISLDEENRGMLTNQEFLSMPELLYHPLREMLSYAIPFKSAEYIQSVSPKFSEEKKDFLVKTPKAPRTASSKILPEERNQLDSTKSTDSIPYIDFLLFAVYLSQFCPKTPIDSKVNFLFRLYDHDMDGVLSPDDLFQTINKLVANNLSQPEIQEVIKSIFAEVDAADKGFIDKEDFQKVLWMTDFDQKTNIHF